MSTDRTPIADEMIHSSGRELEIAVARALGWKAERADGGYYLRKPNGRRFPHAFRLDEDLLWEWYAPAYLRDGNAFATVEAALDEHEVSWEIGWLGHARLATVSISHRNTRDVRGSSRREAFLRAFVAWKGAA